MGQFDIDVPDTLQVNSIEMYSALTKKMFDRDDTSIEAMVSIHAVGNAENNYKDCYITRAYHIDGSGIAYECEGSGMLFDASKGWNTYQRLILPIEKVIDGKEYVSIDFIAPPTWGKDEPYVEHTLDIPFENINYMDGAYINCFVIEDKPYYVVAQYDTAYCTRTIRRTSSSRPTTTSCSRPTTVTTAWSIPSPCPSRSRRRASIAWPPSDA